MRSPIIDPDVAVLGAGMTGLAASCSFKLPVYEAESAPGGICCSYYMRPEVGERLSSPPSDGEAYRFEIGGGHWIFGGDELVLEFIRSLTEVTTYSRKSAVYFLNNKTFVPYPIQDNLRFLGSEIAHRALCEMSASVVHKQPAVTLADWLRVNFGETLCELFFDPFHKLYTAGLWNSIAPQDAYKSPVDLPRAIRGAFNDTNPVGYNTTFIYPVRGLDDFAHKLASRCDVRYGKGVVKIDSKKRNVHFADGSRLRYGRLLSTLPLNRMMTFTGLEVGSEADPSPSVLVFNIGAKKGPACPAEHWLYVPHSKSGFHRVGFYSNVDPAFLPASARAAQDRVSIYVERAYPESEKPSAKEVAILGEKVTQELQEWGWIQGAEVVDPTWIEVAYTWSRPGSNWRPLALKALQEHGIFQVGRYARWNFQGIADSIRDGLFAGAAMSGHQSANNAELRVSVTNGQEELAGKS